MDEALLEQSVFHLVDKYESLRVKIVQVNGQWLQQIYPVTEAVPFAWYDLSAEPPEKQNGRLKEVCIQERDQLAPEKGNMIRIVYFRFSASEGRIWFCLHHLIADFMTVLIVTNEFMAAYNSLARGKELKRQPDNEFRKWLYLMEGMTRYVLLPTELSYWATLPWHKAGVLPSDFPDRFPTDDSIVEAIRKKKILDTYRVCEEVLDAALTLALYNRCGSDFENYLIAVFFLAVAGEKQADWLDINVANSGRNIMPADYGVNTYKLVGYIATARALLLQRPDSGNLLADIEQLTEQMKRIPNGGLGFFLLREFIPDDELRNSWYSRRQQGEIFFNYTGRVNTTFMNDQYETIEEDTGRNIHIEEFQNTLLSCFVTIHQHRLIIRFGYSAVYLKERTIQNMANAMVAMFREIVSKQINPKIACV